jgi:hypothetical protein
MEKSRNLQKKLKKAIYFQETRRKKDRQIACLFLINTYRLAFLYALKAPCRKLSAYIFQYSA